MLEANIVWTSSGSSGPLTAYQLDGFQQHSVLFCQSSTLGSTQSFAMQTAQDSTGPWFTEGSTSLGATASATGQAQIRVTGPYTWVRPYLNSASTGTYQFRLVAQS